MKFQIYGSLLKRKIRFNDLTYLEYILSKHVMTYWWAQWSHPGGTGVYLTKADTLDNN